MILALAALCASPLVAPQDGDDFLEKALAFRESSSWTELVELAKARIDATEEDDLPLALLAIGQAGLKESSAAIETLKRLEERGITLDATLSGLGSPMVEVVNTLYSHCWANFDPAFNRSCWEPLFTQFPDSRHAPIAATRLLMASLKEGNESEAAKYEDFFEQRLNGAREAQNHALEADLTKRFVDGYLRAGVSNARVMELAVTAWDGAWETASRRHAFDGPLTGGDLSILELEARRECELDTDHEFNTLTQAFFLAGVPLTEGHPLFAMEAEPSVTFTDCTEETGLSGVRASRIAAADYDRDGDPDLCLAGRLFENEGGQFRNVSADRGVKHTGAAALFGDYDGDGYLDLIIASKKASHLYRSLGKRGKFAFEDVTVSSGLEKVPFPSTPEGVAWVDADDDGDLDLYFALYEQPMSQGHPDILLVNQGDGTFSDSSEARGVRATGPFCGRGVSPCDVDGDGDTEILVSNYRLNENLFWSWNGEQLVDQSELAGIKGVRQPANGKYFGHTIGSCWGDVDGDGDVDLFSANLAHPRFVHQGFSNLSLLGINQGDGTFADESLVRGIRFQETHSDPALVDIDNDGDLDLSLTCIYEGVTSALYQNDGQGNFAPITFRAGAAAFHAWGQAWLDFDGDGFLDVVYGSSNGVRVLRNSGNQNHFIRLALESKGRDPFAFGAIVTVEATEEESPRKWVRQLVSARGTSSQDEPILHFGLGDYGGRVSVSVRWPDTDRVESKTPRVDRVFAIKQGRKAK